MRPRKSGTVVVAAVLLTATIAACPLNIYGKALSLANLRVIPAGLLVLYLLWRSRDTFDNNVVVCFVAVGLAFGMTGYMARETWNTIGSPAC